ncbi:L,D-transpeptidase family protein [Massilia sp. SYSU DXS3249]
MSLSEILCAGIAGVRRLPVVLLVLMHAVAAAGPGAPAEVAALPPVAQDAPAPQGPAAGHARLPWLAADGAQARLALRLLGDAAAHGLDPEHYGFADLAHRLDAPRDAAADAAFERDLGSAMARYLADLHAGRTASAYRAPGNAPAPFDPHAVLARALGEARLEQVVDAAPPAIPLYRRVMATLAHYRELARLHPSWRALPAVSGAGVAAGDSYAGAALLRERLRILGDLDADAGAPSAGEALYTAGLAAGLRRFQARHGLPDDGVLGAKTLAALAVPLPHRVDQLALTLERLRWLPALPPGRIVVVNLPAYRLWAFDTRNGQPAAPLDMRVIVGTAAKTPTPLFVGQMRYLELNPYWNVPRSITLGEILPKLARNPAYLRQNDMELVAAAGKALPTGDAAAALRSGKARLRQRPGARNVLGGVKFAMPNPMNIYLHSTSSKEPFDRTRRDLSHGCIRVERPIELAQFVLADPDNWDTARIEAAIGSGKTRTLQLPETLPVVLFYATAVTDRQGRALFADDIYGQDPPLLRALHAP